uniref:hypothetical protein n=1 Tax=Shewanella sp. TaxID=50422 RepID=UPI004048028D
MAEEHLETLETEEGGNTNNPSSSPPKQPTQHLHHTFTWNNYPEGAIEILLNLFNNISYDYVFQEEQGDSGTPHLQGVVSLKKRARWTEFGLPNCIHWEKVKHLPLCYEYCSRPSKRVGRVWSLKFVAPKKLKVIAREQLFEWQTKLLDYIQTEPDDRTIYWVWSTKGRMGKSSFARFLLINYKCILLGKGQYSDIMNSMYNANTDINNVVIFNLPRNNGNKISYSALESIKDGLIVNTKYETGAKVINPPHIIVFSNAEPKYDEMSEDRFIVINVD